MNIIILGAAGFIGTNLTLQLSEREDCTITVVDRERSYFSHITEKLLRRNVTIIESDFVTETDFDFLLRNQDVVYHLVSSNAPTTSNQRVPQELMANVINSAIMLDACVKNNVKKVVFVSSGGTVYGKESGCPLSEETPTYPITSYGVQKITIEKLLYLYNYMYGLDYRIIRLANPYGPYQRPNGMLGAITTFTYKALKNEDILVYGDGSVVRDFIYIDDAIKGMNHIVFDNGKFHTYNLGCGYGTCLNEILSIIRNVLGTHLNVVYKEARKVDVPINYLDISRYESDYGALNPISIEEGIRKTIDFLKLTYGI